MQLDRYPAVGGLWIIVESTPDRRQRILVVDEVGPWYFVVGAAITPGITLDVEVLRGGWSPLRASVQQIADRLI